jgi:hypothetical protein
VVVGPDWETRRRGDKERGRERSKTVIVTAKTGGRVRGRARDSGLMLTRGILPRLENSQNVRNESMKFGPSFFWDVWTRPRRLRLRVPCRDIVGEFPCQLEISCPSLFEAASDQCKGHLPPRRNRSTPYAAANELGVVKASAMLSIACATADLFAIEFVSWELRT